MKPALGTLADILPKQLEPMISKPTPAMVEEVKAEGEWNLATATAYNGLDDIYGSTTARPNQYGVPRAIPNSTIAVDPETIPYGSVVEVMLKDGTVKRFFACDTGSAVKARTASIGRGNLDKDGKPIPVIDFYTPKEDLIGFNDQIGDTVRWRIVPA